MKKKEIVSEDQLSLFSDYEITEHKEPKKPTTVLDFVKARFEHGPEMTQEDYKRWIRILVQNSFKSID